MDVILLEKIHHLGDLGDTVKVKSGYGRNYLVPQGKALPATEANRKVFDERRAELIKKSEDSLAAAKMRAEQLAGKALTIKARASEQGKLYGSVSPADIVRAAAEQGVELHKAEVDMADGPIHELGASDVHLRLHSEVELTISVTVEEEKDEAAAAAS